MKYILLLFFSSLTIMGAKAQNSLTRLVETIEENNTTLRALKTEIEGQKLSNGLGVAFPDPEIEIGLLGSKGANSGIRKDFSFRQGFDIPLLSGEKGRVVRQENKLLDYQYRVERMNLKLEILLCAADIIYQNALIRMLEQRKKHTRILADIQRKKWEAGANGLPEVNNALLKLSTIEGEIKTAEIERTALLDRLTALNGGKNIELTDTAMTSPEFPNDFETWYAHIENTHPLLAYAENDWQLSVSKMKLTRSEQLPSFSIGYVSESTPGETFRGISLGVNIPLWSNRRRMRQAQTEISAAEARREDAKIQMRHRLKTIYRRALGLQQAAKTYREALNNNNNTKWLKKAFEAGEISLSAYLLEIGFYYEAAEKALTTERDYHRAMAELLAMVPEI